MWTNDLSVGSQVIDSEHKQLFDLIQKFYEGIKDNSPKERLEELILGLVNYTKTHFANEEKYMRSLNYPGIDAHIKLHENFVEQVNGYYDRLKSGKLILSLEVTNFLKDWLIKHIKGADQQYAAFSSQQ